MSDTVNSPITEDKLKKVGEISTSLMRENVKYQLSSWV
jgi:hypothetical protein